MSTKNLASVFVLLLASVTSVANAQQQPGTNVPTPRPAPAAATDAPTAAPAPAISPLPVVSDPNEPVIDATTTRSTYPNRPLMVTGLVVFAGSYGASAIIGGMADREDDKKLVYPVAGPWMDLANRDCVANTCSNEDLNKGLLIADGVVQGLGALGVLMSFVLPEKSTRRWYLIGQEGTHITPMKMGYAGFGVGASGQF
ncbi:MAG TPA: hypothetical protein VK540_24240 [Polyangiaceae bacterium]|jgi:hypothetical protein|nr:hypothetical protein [Polyangiaceae bacterium]